MWKLVDRTGKEKKKKSTNLPKKRKKDTQPQKTAGHEEAHQLSWNKSVRRR